MCGCDRALELISLRLDGEIEEDQRWELEEHLDACAACRSLARELEQLHAAMPQLEEPLPEGFHAAVMDRVRAEKVVPFSGGRKKRVGKWASMAAVFAVILVGAGTLRGYLDSPEVNAPAPGERVLGAAKSGLDTAQDGPGVEPYAATAETAQVPGARAFTGYGLTEPENRTPTEEERAALTANCVAWSLEHGQGEWDAESVSIAPVTQADLESAVCDEGARERLDMGDWRVTGQDAAGQTAVTLLCDGETFEVLGYLLSQ